MKKMKLPLVAISAILGFVACSDDANPMVGGGDANGGSIYSSGSDYLGFDFSSSSAVLGDDLSSSSLVIPGNEVSCSSVGGSDDKVSSSSVFIPGNDVSSSSVSKPNNGTSSSSVGNPGNGGSGDDENDNEDARTLNGTQILLKVSGTTATVENNNGCVEVADKSATITCPGAYYVTGESSDFQVVVNTPGTNRVPTLRFL